MRKSFILLCAGLLTAACGTATKNTNDLPVVSENNLKAHLEFLAADSVKGRASGTEGYQVAADYVASQYRRMGLIPNGDNGSYFQQVKFFKYNVDVDTIDFTLGKQDQQQKLVFGDDFKIFPNMNYKDVDLNAELVWVGFGLDIPEKGITSYKNVDVKGKIAVIAPALPKGLTRIEASFYSKQRYVHAALHGAKGIIQLGHKPRVKKPNAKPRPKREPRAPRRSSWMTPEQTFPDNTPGVQVNITLGSDASVNMLTSLGVNIDEFYQQIKDKKMPVLDLSPIQMSLRYQGDAKPTYSSPNVVAMLPGSDPELSKEVIVISAHLDGLGVVDGKIHNGLMDNATGVASILEVANTFVKTGQIPKRTLVFVALTNEETGLQGADYYARYPSVDRASIVANINLDMPILTFDFADVIAFGAEFSNLGEPVAKAASLMGLTLTPDPLPQKRYFFRSDHIRFAEQGIPSIMLMNGLTSTEPDKVDGMQHYKDFMKYNYHAASDDIHIPILWDVMAKFTLLNWVVTKEIANSEQVPAWHKNNFFDLAYGKK